MAQVNSEIPITPTGFVDSRWFYRILEIIPGSITWIFLLSPIILSFVAPIYVAYFIIAFDLFWLLKSVRMSFSLIMGYRKTRETESIDWAERLKELKNIEKTLLDYQQSLQRAIDKKASKATINTLKAHVQTVQEVYKHRRALKDPDNVMQCVIMPLYNESFDVVKPSIDAIVGSNYSMKNIVFVFSYEQRGGKAAKETARQAEEEFGNKFGAYFTYCHPDGVPGELKGKGANITYAARKITKYFQAQKIDASDVIITTLDCDNRVHSQYFSRLTYSYCVNPNRKRSSFQPLALFFNNIWDVPAPMRVIATGNSFWVMIESVRKGRLRNFASHAQSLDALLETDFWSITSPVEDGHQFYRSYFAFNGDYMVEPLFLPIYQSAPLAGSYFRSLLSQFKQLQRWAYGVSDFPYVVKNSIKDRVIPASQKLLQIGRLFEGHLSWATAPLILTFAAWAPLYLNREFNREALAHQLPIIASNILTLAMIGLFITIWISFIMIPKRPAHLKPYKTILMVAQWILVPITAIIFGSFAAITAQTRLMFGRYIGFYVTEKVVKK